MDRETRRIFAAVLAILVVLTGTAVLLLGRDPSSPSGAPEGTTNVVGVIVGIDSAGLGDVRSFTLRADGGTLYTFGLAELENGDVFPPAHMAEHQATAEPVRVYYREAAGTLLAIRVDDAPRPAAS